MYTPTEYLHLNNCRLYLKCFYISEITNDYGTHILPHCITPPSIPTNLQLDPSSTSTLRWPQQDIPPPIAWNTWRKFLSTIVKPNSDHQLKTPLGVWLPTFQQTRQWHFYYHNDTILQINPTSNSLWVLSDTTRNHYTFIPQQTTSTPTSPVLQNHHIPISPIKHNDTFTLKIRRINLDSLQPQPVPPNPNSQYFQSENCTMITPESFQQLLSAPTIYIFTSHVVELSIIRLGWSIATSHETLYQGHSKLQSSSNNTDLRGACSSIISAILHYLSIYDTQQCPIPKQQIYIFTNNKIIQKRLDRSAWIHDVVSKQFRQEHNNVCLIKNLLSSLPRCRLEPLTQPSDTSKFECNVQTSMTDCHQYANQAQTQCTSIMSIPVAYYRATLFINNVENPTSESNHMRYAALSPDLRSFFKQKYSWSHATINFIDWEVHSRALNSQHPTNRKTLMQYIHRWLPTHGHPCYQD